MFYHPLILNRHSGCFSTIWLVATQGIRVPRRDFLKVNVKTTCDNIMKYVLEQVPPPHPGLPRPRLSLYLSSQLQYGTVVVYHRQCGILLEELQFIVGQLLKQKTWQKINMVENGRQVLDIPDALSLMEEAEGAPDPLFGVMYMGDATLSPSILIQRSERYERETSPELPEQTSPADAEPESSFTASPEAITLREREPAAVPVAEFEGVELVDELQNTIDLLLAQPDDFPEGGDLEMQRKEMMPVEEEREIERGGRVRDLEKEGTKELTGSTLELQPTTLSGEDAMLLAQEETGLSVEQPGPPADQLTPTPVPVLPSPPPVAKGHGKPTLELEVEPSPEKKTRKRKRQLIFFDQETQLSQEELQKQIDNPQIETKHPLLPPPSSHRMLSAAELLNNPCSLLPEEVQFLWRQAATVTPVSGSNLQIGEREPSSESTDSRKESDVEIVALAEHVEEALEFSSKEVPRDLTESEEFDISVHGSLSLEGSDRPELSREISPMYTPEGERSLVSRSVSVLQDIPEVPDELLETASAESPELQLELTELEAVPVLFKSLLPPEVDRRTVSKMFQRLLENLSARKLRAEQDEPYGDILISPGNGHEEL